MAGVPTFPTIDVAKIKARKGKNTVNTAYGHELLHRQSNLNQFQSLDLDLNEYNLKYEQCKEKEIYNENNGNTIVTKVFKKFTRDGVLYINNK